MDEILPLYIYEPNFLVAYILPLILVFSVFHKKLFPAMLIAILLVRPNERFDISISFPTILFGLSMLGLIIYFDQFKNYKYEKDEKVLLLLIGYLFINTIIFHPSQLNRVFMVAGVGMIRYFIIVILLSNKEGSKYLYFCLFIVCCIIIFEALYYHYYADEESVEWILFHGSTGRIRGWGIWGNANETSFISCLGTMGIVLLFLSAEKKGLFILMGGVAIPLLLLIIFLTASRTGLGCFFFIFIGLIYKVKNKFIKGLVGCFLLGAIVIAPYLTPEREDKEASSEERAELREKGIELAKAYPIQGVGYLRAPEETGGMAIHNTYVQAFAEMGLIGGGLFIYFLALGGLRVYKMHKLVDKSDNTVVRNINSALLGIYFSGVLYFLFGNQLLTAMFYTFMALLRVSCNAYQLEPEDSG